MRKLLLLVVLFMVLVVFAEQAVLPVFYVDENLKSFQNIIVKDSLIYVLGRNEDFSYLYIFDDELNLKLKHNIGKRFSHSEFSTFQDGFFIKSHYGNEFTHITKRGEIISEYKLKGSNMVEFIENGQNQIISLSEGRLSLHKLNDDLSLSESSLILETGFDHNELYHHWDLYSNESNYYLFYQNKSNIIKYSFTKDWVLFYQAAIINKEPEKYYQLDLTENRINLSLRDSEQLLVYDFKGNYLSSETKVVEEEIEDIIQTKSELMDSLTIESLSGKFRYELKTDFSFGYNYALLDEKRIVLAGGKNYFAGTSQSNESLIVILDNPKSALQLNYSSEAGSMELAYKNQSIDQLAGIFSGWQGGPLPELKVDEEMWEREAYILFLQIFPEFYNLFRRKWEKAGKYHTIKDEIEIVITDTIKISESTELKRPSSWRKLYGTEEKHAINDFHPYPDIGKEITFLDKTRRETLLQFFSYSGTDDEDLRKRMSFLGKYVNVRGLHWSGKPNLFSQPAITRIVFDEDYAKAIVSYVNVHSGGSFLCSKTAGKWKKVRGISNWIQ